MNILTRYLMMVISASILLYACIDGGKIMPGRDHGSVDYGDYGESVTPGDYGDYGRDVRQRKTIKQ